MWKLVFAAEAASDQPPQGPSSLFQGPIFLLVAFFGIMYFLIFRPQQKREKERQEMLASLSKGDKVVTTGGICGAVVGLTEKNVVLRVSDDPIVKMEFLRGAIAKIVSKSEEN